jgi:4-hydroxythreonine-4-phosphate dehydrogenase
MLHRLDTVAGACSGSRVQKRPLAITMGEPAGIGGEILLKAWTRLHTSAQPFVAFDDPDRLIAAARLLSLDVPIRAVVSVDEAIQTFHAALPVMPVPLAAAPKAGALDPRNAPAVITSIEQACRLAMQGAVAGVVTSPIQKSVLTAHGFPHPGHTEFLAALAGVPRTVMMLVGLDLRVVPLTIHVPHRDVPGLLTRDVIMETARIVDAALRHQFGIAQPRLALAGLNPHAGEAGTIGREEIDVLGPAAEALRREGIDITAPLPADTLFHAAARRNYDVALCPTHDQALIPLKTLAFDDGVNMTLGLPFIRTSPDHGTALDIAGKGLGRPDSMIAAIQLAGRLAARAQETHHAIG